MGESRIQRSTTLFAPAAIPALHQQTPVGEVREFFRLGAGLEMPGDRAPAIAAHRSGAVVVAPDAEGHALGGAADKFRMQQRVELFAVARSQRSVERAG